MSLWSRAASVAARTPASRNRYVDFLRAVSILMVISGHWLVAAPYVVDGRLTLGSMLEYQRWTQLLSWAFQVMPVFFFVGGYSNGVSWKAALRDGKSYAEWLDGRLQRLAGPVLPLLVVWALLGIAGHLSGVRPEMVKVGSQMALIPIWFLAVYVGVVLVVPLTYAAWRRFGMASFWLLAVAVAVSDFVFFAGFEAVGWLNYGFIWIGVHQLGYAWRDGKLQTGARALLWTAAGLAILIVLVTLGPYPLSMVSVPGEEVSNSLPPKLPMLLLGMIQIGLALALEAPARRWLERPTPWTGTVLVNGMIMTIFLWHLTASTLIIGLALQLGSVGLAAEPGSGVWWAVRPVWLGVYLLGLAGFALVFGLFERGGSGGPPAAAWRQIVGAAMICGGLALLALDGIGAEGWLGLRWWVVLLPLVGAVLAGVNPLARAKGEKA
jgi:fucose 4-O-acetylase-like acetyltransferase